MRPCERTELTTTTTIPSDSGARHRPDAGAIGPAPAALPTDRVARIDGLRWHYRVDHEHVLQALPASAWADPAAQGWERVKHNARRDVWRAELGGHAYYAKYYYQDRGLRRLLSLLRQPACVAEWAGGTYALDAGIPAIEPVAYATGVCRKGRRCALLITRAVEPAEPLCDYWRRLISAGRGGAEREDIRKLTELLAAMIARAHQAGFEHLDMHAANILVQTLGPRRYRTVFVDLQSARRGVPLRLRAVVRNLAQLNQWFRRHSTTTDRLRFLRAYFRWRNEFETQYSHGRPLGAGFRQLVRRLARVAEHHAARLWAQRDRRLTRDGRYFARLKLAHGWRGMAILRFKHAASDSRASQFAFSRDWWRTQLAEVLAERDAGDTANCKDSHSARVWRTTLAHPGGALPVIAKQPRARSGWRRLVQLLPPSRSRRGWDRGHALLHRDLRTARPLAYLERRVGPFVRESMLICEALPYATDLETWLRELPAHGRRRATALKRRVTLDLAGALRELLRRGFAHRDCKASNLLVLDAGTPKLVWIDMDGLRATAQPDLLRPLARLDVSLRDVPIVTRTDRARFLRAFAARFGGRPDEWRALWRAVAPVSAAKLRAKVTRTAWKQQHYGRA